LTNPIYLEVVSQCVESAIEIRQAFVSVIKDVDFPNERHFPVALYSVSSSPSARLSAG
jgi:hypothetical protein